MRDLNSESDLNALKVPELKEELEARGILDKKLKLKKDLVEALHEYLLTQGTSGAAKAPEPTANGVNAAAQAKAHAAEEAKRAAEQEKAEIEAKKAAEKAKQDDKEKAEKEAKEKEAKEKAERAAKEKAEKEAKEKAEKEAKEKAEKEAKEKAERAAKEKAQKEAKEKAAKEAKDKAEKERVEKEGLKEKESQDGKRGQAGEMTAEEAQRKKEEEELRARLLQGQQKRGSDADGGLKRTLSDEQGVDDNNGEKKKRRGWGSGSTASRDAPAAINTSMLKDIITATVSANNATDAERPAPRQRERSPHEDVELDYGSDQDESQDPSHERGEPVKGASASLHIVNFTRPLNLREVHQLLGQYGALVEGEDGFWMDRQKRRCLCTYETPEMAAAARKGIHGLRFPDINPKLLEVEFVASHELATLRHDSAPHTAAPRPSAASERSERIPRAEPERAPEAKTDSKDEQPSEDVMELDKLFKKTEAQPPIYWKPLSDGQVKEREERMGRH